MKFFKKIIRELFRSKITKNFANSAKYWEERYYYGGNSGKGSYFQEAIEKADYLNAKIKQYNIDTIVDIGCGDGNNLKLFEIRNYYGFDVSKTIINFNKRQYSQDKNKKFILIDDYFDNTLLEIRNKKDTNKLICVSFDVIGHLVEDTVYQKHLANFLLLNPDYLIVSNSDEEKEYDLSLPHIKLRNYSRDLINDGWTLIDVHPKNKNLKLFKKNTL